ncbi:uncharacterized protein LOC127811524 isoform X2 [Diospyros lotus]|uniref:uncharacterized protein LOC127811524 isoform X2 n=1 Tax=Diospyros lotus TaxID=55363 RepID=UPI002253D809|nr:uncharacterized protein LOC127811524 isoform X2 [Diospyros lotus]
MGGSRSSSKRKSSKKKASKISSEAVLKRKSRRTKYKKLRHLDDSSSCSDDYSSSSASFLSSTSDNKYSRARSRTRRDADSRKRSRRSPSSESCSQDSRHRKKRKGSKRSSMSEKRKKSQKKHRRDPSVSSTGSDSQSCSTCRVCSSSENKGEFKRHRDRYTEKTKYVKDLSKAKSGPRERKTAYMSCSSCCRYSDDSSYGSKDMMPIEENPKRLRSVIIVAKSPEEEENEWHKDGPDDEIVHDPNDCPTSGGKNSTDMGSKRKTIHQSQVHSDGRVVNMVQEGAFVSGIKMTDLAKAGEQGGLLDSQGYSHREEAVANNSSKENEGGVLLTACGANNSIRENEGGVFLTACGANNDDLESILRLKALENLRKYRGGLQKFAKPPADEKNRRDGDLKQLSTAKVEFVENRVPKEDGSGVLSVDAVLDQNPKPTIGIAFSSPAASYEPKVQQGEVIATGSGRSRLSVVCTPNQMLISSGSNLSPVYANINKSEMGKSALGQESLGNNSVVKETHEANIKATESNVNKSLDKKAKIVVQTSNGDGVGVNNVNESDTAEPSSLKPTREQHSSKKQPDEDKDRSQFEQKTMSVMRGGEMVQVRIFISQT